ncbi:MAG: hypothetical protein AAF404_05215 [Pseudomonadota bacterium]
MPAVSAVRKAIVCLFLCGVVLSVAGHRFQSKQQAAQITWHDVNQELQHVELARAELFDALHRKITARQ